MSQHLLRDLENLHRDILALAGLVEQTIFQAIQALTRRDVQLAYQVISTDAQIDEEENHVNEECLKILALHQPVAIDLRRIASAMMIVVDLERMGDLAEEIAECALELTRRPGLPTPIRLEEMTELCTSMVRQSLDAFVNLDVGQARLIHRLNEDVDDLATEIREELIRQVKESPHVVESWLSFFVATRDLKRIADHATNIAEDVLYLVEGEIVRHRPDVLRGHEDDDDDDDD